jgi:O-antigen/teichoic acid export membrane protein
VSASSGTPVKQGIGIKRLGSGAVLAIGHLGEALLPFVRSVALAHMLVPTEFGIAIALSTTASIIELFTDLGLDRMALRLSASADPLRARDTLHAVNLLRGLLNGAILALLGPVLAAMMGFPDKELVFASLGLTCIARGMINFDTKQIMQRYVYWPEGTAILGLQIAWTFASILFAIRFPDARAMALGIVVGQSTYMIITHLLAQHRWRLAWDRGIVREALSYGLPLIPSSIVTAANSLLDRYIVGGVLGPAVLGFYSAIYMIVMMPRAILSRLLNNLIIPVFINKNAVGEDGEAVYNAWAIVSISTALLVSVATACLGRPVLLLVYGQHFVPSALISVVIAADFIPKFLICLVGTPALALGHTRDLFRWTVMTLPGIVVGGVTVALTHSLDGFLIGMLVADIGSMLVLVRVATRRYPYSKSLVWSLLGACFAVMGACSAVILKWHGVQALDLEVIELHVAVGLVSLVFYTGFLLWVADPYYLEFVKTVIKRLRKRPA